MNNLVEVKRGKIYTTSLKFAEEFYLNHQHVLEKIRNLAVAYPTVKKQFKEDVFTNKRNREYPFFWLDRDGYLTLIMNTSSRGESAKLLFEKKQLFIQAFNKMEQIILKQENNKNNVEWLTHREQGKTIRLELTDTIKDFVDYATKQGSKSAQRYYMNITKMEYKALNFVQLGKPKLRETLDTLELYQLLLAEDICKRSIKRSMEEGLHYKEIYIVAKQDVEKYANVVLIK